MSGTAVITSREMDTIVGRIMIARMTPAANSPTPKGGPMKDGDPAQQRYEPGLQGVTEEGAQDEDAPQTDDDARDGGQQLDQEGQRDGDPARRQFCQEDRREQADRGRDEQRQGREASVPTTYGNAP